MIRNCTLLLLTSLFFQQSYAGGVSLGSTRLVYPTSKEQITLKIYNTDEKDNYLVQSWVSDVNNEKSKDFIVTPPLFVIKSGSDNLLKVVYVGDKSNLPQNMEKMFFLNSKVIPSLSEKEQQIDNALLISTTTKIKLFIRPDSIKEDSFESYKMMKCNYDSEKIKVSNPSPFYMNLVSLSINGSEVSAAETIPPMSSIYLNYKSKGSHLSFNFINDYGVQVKDRQCNLN